MVGAAPGLAVNYDGAAYARAHGHHNGAAGPTSSSQPSFPAGVSIHIVFNVDRHVIASFFKALTYPFTHLGAGPFADGVGGGHDRAAGYIHYPSRADPHSRNGPCTGVGGARSNNFARQLSDSVKHGRAPVMGGGRYFQDGAN